MFSFLRHCQLRKLRIGKVRIDIHSELHQLLATIKKKKIYIYIYKKRERKQSFANLGNNEEILHEQAIRRGQYANQHFAS